MLVTDHGTFALLAAAATGATAAAAAADSDHDALVPARCCLPSFSLLPGPAVCSKSKGANGVDPEERAEERQAYKLEFYTVSGGGAYPRKGTCALGVPKTACPEHPCPAPSLTPLHKMPPSPPPYSPDLLPSALTCSPAITLLCLQLCAHLHLHHLCDVDDDDDNTCTEPPTMTRHPRQAAFGQCTTCICTDDLPWHTFAPQPTHNPHIPGAGAPHARVAAFRPQRAAGRGPQHQPHAPGQVRRGGRGDFRFRQI